jgi:hypothetical protein
MGDAMSIFDDIGDHGGVDSAQVCLNGHVINSHYESQAEFNQRYCERCGAEAIVACPHCKGRIIGNPRHVYEDESMASAPSYCTSCGKPMPWHLAKMDAARALTEELDGISDEEKIMLRASLDDLAAEKPMTEVAATRAKRILVKAKGPLAETARKLFVEVASKTAATILTGRFPAEPKP